MIKFVKIKTSIVLTAFIALFILLITAETALACSCVVSSPVDIDFENSKNVAVFKLRSVEKFAEGEKGYGVDGIKQSKLTVEKVFKGNLKIGQEFTFSQGGGGDCGWTFGEKGIGTAYLFYLGEKPAKNTIWSASICSRSNSLKNAAQDLLYLENLEKVRGKTRLSGTLTQIISASIKGQESFYNKLSGRKVFITGNGKNIELETDDNGVYEIYDLPPGNYKITPEKIYGYKFFRNDDSVFTQREITAKRHTEQNFNYLIDNLVSGRFFDTNGKPLKDVCLNLIPAQGEKARYFYGGTCTDKNGRFEIDDVPIGSYVLVINDDGEISSDEPFGTFYYPNVLKREDAAIITIGAGDFRNDLIITAPKTAEIVTISGILLFEDGKTANDDNAEYASVEFSADGEKEYSDKNSSAKVDEKGRFSIRVLKGQKGKLYGKMGAFEGKYQNCPKLEKFIAASENAITEIKTQNIEIEATTDLNGIELMFPFPACKKAKIE